MSAYKWCFVPVCNKTSRNSPGKIFISVPRSSLKKKKWFEAARRHIKDVSLKTTFYCCEDHFNLPEDMENYMEYRLSKVAARIKAEVVPHINVSDLSLLSAERAKDTLVESDVPTKEIKKEPLFTSTFVPLATSADSDAQPSISEAASSFNDSDKIDVSCQSQDRQSRVVQWPPPIKEVLADVATSPIQLVVDTPDSESKLLHFDSHSLESVKMECLSDSEIWQPTNSSESGSGSVETTDKGNEKRQFQLLSYKFCAEKLQWSVRPL